MSSAKRLAMRFRAAHASDTAAIIDNETCLFITVPDTEIHGVAEYLCRKKLLRKNQLVAHVSGIYGTEVIRCVAKLNALPLSIHPASTFSSRSYLKDEFKGIWCALQGSEKALTRGRQMVRALKGKPFILPAEKKPLYHLALVFASNLFVGIEDISIELLTGCGMTKKAAKGLIFPLVSSTLKNIDAKGTRKALTGPVERGDIVTIKKHLTVLSKHQRAFEKTYLELSKHLAHMVEEKGELPKETIRDIRKLLKP
jgi:predicted short-subunit dehydrogenase-like oxidoreductase (DUF2520 family)